MEILCITDLHGQRGALEKILASHPGPDVILLGGDLTNFGTPKEAELIVQRCMREAKRVFAVAGNCDSAAIDHKLKELDVSLFGKGVVFNQVGFYGVSGMPPWRGDMYELTEAEIGAALGAGNQMIGIAIQQVILSHPPPRGTLVDRTARGDHVGSTAVRQWIELAKPTLLVCGHIHEGRGTDQVGDTLVVNCGPAYKGMYAVATLELACVEEPGNGDIPLSPGRRPPHVALFE
jgi:Icc-related predicted phosphoesterase